MATFVLVPGAGGRAWYWHRVVPELERRGHTVVAPDLPSADDDAGLTSYADTVTRSYAAVPGEPPTPTVVVGQSMGALTAVLLTRRLPVDLLVLLNAMIPAPGETGAEWWTVTGHEEARAEQAARDGRSVGSDVDLFDAFFHDVPAEVVEEALTLGDPPQSGTPFSEPWPLGRWPDVATRVLQGRDDRFFPVEFQRRLARERLGIDPDEMPGGHLLALSRPVDLADRLDAYVDSWEAAV